MKFGVATSGISTLDMFNQYFRQVIVILVGFVLVRQEAIGADIFIAFYLFEEQLCGYLVKLMNKWKEFKGCQGCVRRISHIFSEPEEALSGKAPQEDGQICFDQVCFCYDDKQVLDHVSFRIPERQLTAIVGRSGAGKSTILKLISAYYPYRAVRSASAVRTSRRLTSSNGGVQSVMSLRKCSFSQEPFGRICSMGLHVP